MKLNYFLIIIVSFLLLLNSCQPLKEGITGTKRSKSSDEFFVQKKKPLVLPPDFSEMPKPKPTEKKQNKAPTIEDLIQMNEDENETSRSTGNKSLEESVLERIKSN
tara:strand:+ start:219 stop:536 length:318 start_codon:yes stop_codon:yes gene_type:complete